MPRNASGVMSLSGVFAIPSAIPGSTAINGYIGDLSNETTDSLSRTGKGGMQADLAMGSHRITGMLAGIAASDGVIVEQMQVNVTNAATSVSGTGDAIVASFTPAIDAYITNLALRVTAPGANTITAPVINVDGLGNKTIKKLNSQALVAGDIAGSGHVLALVYNGTDMLLLNPSAPIPALNYEPLGEYTALNEQTAHYTFALTDKGKLVSGNHATVAMTFTIPLNATVAFPVKSRIDLFQRGVAVVSIAIAGGGTLLSSGSKKRLATQWSGASLTKIDTDTWLLVGDIMT